MAALVSTPHKYSAKEIGGMLTRQQAAQALGVGPERVRQMHADGSLPALSTPLGNLYDPKDVEALRLSRET
jgi:hypothetical protein